MSDNEDKRYTRVPKACIGDIVNIKGYGNRTFEVLSIMHEIYVDADVSYDEVYYDCYSYSDGDYYFADDEDITVVSRPEQVDFERLSEHSKNMDEKWSNVSEMVDGMSEMLDQKINQAAKELGEAFNDVHKRDTNKRKSKSKKERIDDLLIELYDVNQLIKNFGEHEDDDRKDRKYSLRKNEIEAKLKEIVDEERG